MTTSCDQELHVGESCFHSSVGATFVLGASLGPPGRGQAAEGAQQRGHAAAPALPTRILSLALRPAQKQSVALISKYFKRNDNDDHAPLAVPRKTALSLSAFQLSYHLAI